MRKSHKDDYEDDEEKNFFNKDNEDEDDYDDYYDEFLDGQMDDKFFYENQKIKILEIAIKQQKLRRKLLSDAIKNLEKSHNWKSLGNDAKLDLISKTYELFSKLVFNFPEDEKEEENPIT